MSRFLSRKHALLTPYTPGEQPQDMVYTKLNTNQSPYPPPPAVTQAAAAAAGRLNLYNDPACTALRTAAAGLWGVEPENVLATNGSDEALYFTFFTFCDETRPLAFPDVSYGFYSVYAGLLHIPAHVIPLRDDFSLDPADYMDLHENVVIANPNAPTGMALTPAQIEPILRSNGDNVVVVDEAYVDFGAESCVPLIKKYDNLLVIQTFSKSRSLAGARLGFIIGSPALIRDLNTVRYSVHPYNVNAMTQAAGIAAIAQGDYYADNCRRIRETRAFTAEALEALGFQVLPSRANFLFARSPAVSGGELYRALKARGVLVRWFDQDRIRDFVRITVGSREQMELLLAGIRAILKERGA